MCHSVIDSLFPVFDALERHRKHQEPLGFEIHQLDLSSFLTGLQFSIWDEILHLMKPWPNYVEHDLFLFLKIYRHTQHEEKILRDWIFSKRFLSLRLFVFIYFIAFRFILLFQGMKRTFFSLKTIQGYSIRCWKETLWKKKKD